MQPRILASALAGLFAAAIVSTAHAQALSSADSCAVGAGGSLEGHALIAGASGGAAAMWETGNCTGRLFFESGMTGYRLSGETEAQRDPRIKQAAIDAYCATDYMQHLNTPLCVNAHAAAKDNPPALASVGRAPPYPASEPQPARVQVASAGPVELPVAVQHDNLSAQICEQWRSYNDWNKQHGLQSRQVPEQCR